MPDAVTAHEESLFRLYLMRALYFLNFAFLGMDVWPSLLNHVGPWDPVRGIALSFWAALSTLSALGIRYPLKMLPVMLMQLVYKLVWVFAVGLPLRAAGPMSPVAANLFKVCAIGILVDLVVIPWPYVLRNYVKAAGDRWRPAGRPAGQAASR